MVGIPVAENPNKKYSSAELIVCQLKFLDPKLHLSSGCKEKCATFHMDVTLLSLIKKLLFRISWSQRHDFDLGDTTFLPLMLCRRSTFRSTVLLHLVNQFLFLHLL